MRNAAHAAAPEAVLHLAWSIGPHCHDSADNLGCVGGSLALLRGLSEAGCPRLVFVGTHLELAPSDGPMHEGLHPAPRDLYSVCKDAVHTIARAHAAQGDALFTWVRLFNLYGPGQADWSLVPYLIGHLTDGRRCPMTHGRQERTFLHVRDAVEALLAIARSGVAGVVHVGSDEVVTVRDLALRVGERLGRADLLSFGALEPAVRDAPRIVPSIVRLTSEVGFRPKLSLDEGLADTIAHWRSTNRPAVET
jgi:nucleoside-diphosphate-sugar epimerase